MSPEGRGGGALLGTIADTDDINRMDVHCLSIVLNS